MIPLIYPEFSYPWQVKAQILALCYSAVMIVSYNFFEVGSIHQRLQKYFVDQHVMSAQEFEVQFDIMVCITSLGTAIFSIFLGYLQDKVGYRVIMIIFSIMTITSQCMLNLGFHLLSFKLINFGKFLGTITFSCIQIPTGTIIMKYFGPDQQFAQFNSIMVAFWVLGCILNSFIAASIVEVYGIVKAELLPLMLSVIGSLLIGLFCFIDALNDKIYQNQLLIEENTRQIGYRFSLARFRSIIGDHFKLYISLMMQRGINSMFLAVASIFFYGYWGKSDGNSLFQQDIYDADVVGLFWVITFIILFPTGYALNSTFKNHIYEVLMFSSILQLIGFAFMLVLNPFYTMPLMGVSMALRWSCVSPIIIKLSPNDFGVASGTLVCLSDLVTFLISFFTGIIINHDGSYVDPIFMMTALQFVALVLLGLQMRYDNSNLFKQEDAIPPLDI